MTLTSVFKRVAENIRWGLNRSPLTCAMLSAFSLGHSFKYAATSTPSELVASAVCLLGIAGAGYLSHRIHHRRPH